MKDRLTDLCVLALALIVFAVGTLYEIRLPGFYYDEAIEMLPGMQIALGDSRPMVAVQSIRLGSLQLPVMVNRYVGAVSTYSVLPFYLLFGVSVESTRFATSFWAYVGLIFGYLFLRDLFGRPAAALTVLLAAISPGYVLWSRMGIYVASNVVPIATATLYFLLRWRRSGQPAYFIVSAFLMGLGMSTKILFLWFIIGLIIAVFMLGMLPTLSVGRWRIGQKRSGREISHSLAAKAGLAFMAGASLLVCYNLTTRETIKFALRNLFSTSAGANNLALLANLQTKLRDLIELLDASWFRGISGPFAANRLMPLLFFTALGLLCLHIVTSKTPERRKPAFMLILMTAIWFQSAFTITGLGAQHLYILYPFLQAIIVLAVLVVAPRRWSTVAGVAVVAVLFASEALTLQAHYRALQHGGGRVFFSDAIYDVAADLDSRQTSQVAAADWGLATSIAILTHGRVWPAEVTGFGAKAPQEDFAQRVAPFLQKPGALFLFHAPAHTAFPGRYAALQQLCAQRGLRLAVEHTYLTRDGIETILLYRTEAIPPN